MLFVIYVLYDMFVVCYVLCVCVCVCVCVCMCVCVCVSVCVCVCEFVSFERVPIKDLSTISTRARDAGTAEKIPVIPGSSHIPQLAPYAIRR